MSRVILPGNATHTITVNNGTARSFVFNADGTLTLPGNFTVGNGTAFKAILNFGNIATSDKTFTFNNRSGTVALEDNNSLTNMLPAQASQGGKVLSTDGAGTLSWITPATASLTSLGGLSTSTYPTQTFAFGNTGLSPAWSSATGTHTLNIPLASTASVTQGLISNADYVRIGFKDATNTWSAAQTFSNAPTITTPGTNPNSVATYQQVLDARNGIGIRPPVDALDATNYTTGLPTAASIGGFTAAIGSRYLFTNLTGAMSSYNNKVYKVASIGPTTFVGGNSTPTPETDGQAGTGAPVDGDILFVRSGTNADQQWAYNGSSWVLYNVAQSWTFSTGLSVAGTTVTVAYGTTGSTACVGNDSRLSDARTPTAHVLDSASHTISDKTAGQVLIATAATTFGFVTFSGDITSISAAGVVTIGKINNVAINDLGLQQNSATLADNTISAALVTGCTWAIATYRAIKINYTITRGAGNYTVGTITLLHDGTSPRITCVEDDTMGTAHGVVFSTDINTGNIRLLYTTTSTGTAATLKFNVIAFPV